VSLGVFTGSKSMMHQEANNTVTAPSAGTIQKNHKWTRKNTNEKPPEDDRVLNS